MSRNEPSPACAAFDGHRRIGSGPLHQVALAVKRAAENGAAGPLLIYDDATGRVIDVDTRGTEDDVVARLTHASVATGETDQSAGSGPPFPPPPSSSAGIDQAGTEPRRRGRPSLGVVAREVTLLPRHWDWLATQPGGASVALRKLVEDARRTSRDIDRRRRALEAAYHFISSIAGDLPGFEEAVRALFAGDRQRFSDGMAAWPADVRDHAVGLGFGDRGGIGRTVG
jgi:hypothetical protein